VIRVEQGGARHEGRDGRVWQMYAVQRWTQEAIGRELGVSQQRVSAILKEVRESIPPPDIAAMRQESIEMYRDISRRAYELAELEGAPVTAGKDGSVVYDPENGGVVRDYGGRIAALKLAREADEQLRKLLGLDAAQKVESTATVRYEIAGINPEALK
jgi:transcriptional regulator with XRE-family HTH domain